MCYVKIFLQVFLRFTDPPGQKVVIFVITTNRGPAPKDTTMKEFIDCTTAKEAFWSLWRSAKNRMLTSVDVETFDALVLFFSRNVEALGIFDKYQGFAAKVLTRKEVKMTAKGYPVLCDIKNEEFAHRCCISEKLWQLGA